MFGTPRNHGVRSIVVFLFSFERHLQAASAFDAELAALAVLREVPDSQ